MLLQPQKQLKMLFGIELLVIKILIQTIAQLDILTIDYFSFLILFYERITFLIIDQNLKEMRFGDITIINKGNNLIPLGSESNILKNPIFIITIVDAVLARDKD